MFFSKKLKFKDDTPYKITAYPRTVGAFFIYDPKDKVVARRKDVSSQWCIATCRDSIFIYWNEHDKHDHIGFFMAQGVTIDIKKLSDKFSNMEKNLGIKDESVLHEVQDHSQMVIIKVSPFWMQTPTHKSFFTLILRLFAVWPDMDLDTAITQYAIAVPSRTGIHYFLKGYTQPTYKELTRKEGGWFGFSSEMANLSEKELALKLIKPTSS